MAPASVLSASAMSRWTRSSHHTLPPIQFAISLPCTIAQPKSIVSIVSTYRFRQTHSSSLNPLPSLAKCPSMARPVVLVLRSAKTLTNLLVLFAVGCVTSPGLDPGSSSRGTRHWGDRGSPLRVIAPCRRQKSPRIFINVFAKRNTSDADRQGLDEFDTAGPHRLFFILRTRAIRFFPPIAWSPAVRACAARGYGNSPRHSEKSTRTGGSQWVMRIYMSI